MLVEFKYNWLDPPALNKMKKFVLFSVFSFALSSYLCANIEEKVSDNSEDPQGFFNTICPHIQARIRMFLGNSYDVFPYLTKTTYENSKYLLKLDLIQMLGMPELKDVKNDEPELKRLRSYHWCRNDRFTLFRALVEDISTGKQKFKVLLRPLLMYLVRVTKTLTEHEHSKYVAFVLRTSSMNYENSLAKLCAKHGQYDLVIELEPSPFRWKLYFSTVQNKESLMEFFKSKSNRPLGMEYERSFMEESLRNPYGYYHLEALLDWIRNCIIYDAPEEFYLELLDFSPELSRMLHSGIFYCHNIPESSNSRIHSLLSKYLQQSNRKEFLNLLNDIRFGGPEMQQNLLEMSFTGYNIDDLIAIAKVAFTGNRQDLFMKLYENNWLIQSDVMDQIMTKSNEVTLETQGKFKIIFDIIATNPNIVGSERHFKFIMKFYAIKHLIAESSDRIYAEFVVLENTAAANFGFPSSFSARFHMSASDIFYHMKVLDKDTLVTFLRDYKKQFIMERTIRPSAELLEFISKSPYLVDKLKFFGFKIDIASIDLFDFIDFEGAEQIANLYKFKHSDLIKLKTRKHVEILERITEKSVADYFADRNREYPPVDGFNYFEWRLAFSHWIKSDQRERISRITEPEILRLLRLEFPREMKEILQE